ncbi:hypothetical protein [Metallosphaera tengchongensis]|uniref:hypothetical protein n=1 Tax=Metallosphaera tengchongensis TaxID=1532350 RepID=UPI001FE74D0C|nr:hypothetical protein [Metallosphaera tengchongensis]
MVYVPHKVVTGSYFEETKYATTFYINNSILFNNKTVINSSSMFTALVEKLNVNGTFITNALSYTGNYTVNETVMTPVWTKSLGIIERGNLTEKFFSYTPNFTSIGKLVSEINKELKIRDFGYELEVNITVEGNAKYQNGTVPFYLTDGFLIRNSSYNVSVIIGQDSRESGNFYTFITVPTKTGYNYSYFYAAAVLIFAGPIEYFFIRKPDIKRVIARNSIQGSAPPANLTSIELKRPQDMLRLMKQYNTKPISYEDGFYIVHENLAYIYHVRET